MGAYLVDDIIDNIRARVESSLLAMALFRSRSHAHGPGAGPGPHYFTERNGRERTRIPHYFTERNGRFSAVSDRVLEKDKG